MATREADTFAHNDCPHMHLVIKHTFLDILDEPVASSGRPKAASDFVVQYNDCSCCCADEKVAAACTCDASTCADSELCEEELLTNKWGCEDLDLLSEASTTSPPPSPWSSVDSPDSWRSSCPSPLSPPAGPPGVFRNPLPCVWLPVSPAGLAPSMSTPVASQPMSAPEPSSLSGGKAVRKQKSSPKTKSGCANSSSHQWPTQVPVSTNCEKTTLMLKNLPSAYTQAKLLETLDTLGLMGKYNFAYLPVDFLSGAGFGYAFVNFISGQDALAALQMLQGFAGWRDTGCRKVLEVCWSDPHQGLDSLIERYRNSRVMHGTVPLHYKPVLLMDGCRIAFPAPTKRIRPPC